jgi:hypothetical protein
MFIFLYVPGPQSVCYNRKKSRNESFQRVLAHEFTATIWCRLSTLDTKKTSNAGSKTRLIPEVSDQRSEYHELNDSFYGAYLILKI